MLLAEGILPKWTNDAGGSDRGYEQSERPMFGRD